MKGKGCVEAHEQTITLREVVDISCEGNAHPPLKEPNILRNCALVLRVKEDVSKGWEIHRNNIERSIGRAHRDGSALIKRGGIAPHCLFSQARQR